MVVFRQNGCIQANAVVFGQKWLCSGKSCCIRGKVVVFGKSGCNWAKKVEFGQKLLYSGKVIVFG